MTYEECRRLFDYDPATGNLIRKVRTSNSVKIGEVAGKIGNHGYRVITRNRVDYLAHHLVWLWHYGEWPKQEIDHINRTRADNRINNLRDVSRYENAINRSASCKLKLLGVTASRNGKFVARIIKKGDCHCLGTFDTAEEAHEAYKAKHAEIHGIDSLFFDEYHKPSPRLVEYCKTMND